MSDMIRQPVDGFRERNWGGGRCVQGLVELVWCGRAIAGGMIEDHHVGCSNRYLLSYNCGL